MRAVSELYFEGETEEASMYCGQVWRVVVPFLSAKSGRTGCDSLILLAAQDMVDWSRLQYFPNSVRIALENWIVAHAASALTSKLRAPLAADVKSLRASWPMTALMASITVSTSGFWGRYSSTPSRKYRTKYSSPSRCRWS